MLYARYSTFFFFFFFNFITISTNYSYSQSHGQMLQAQNVAMPPVILHKIFNNMITVTPRGLPQAVFSNRRSRPYNVAVRSSYLTAGSYTMYRRAHSCRQAASSRNVEFCYVFHARTDIRDHRRERWRDLSIVGVVLKMRQRNHLKSVYSL